MAVRRSGSSGGARKRPRPRKRPSSRKRTRSRKPSARVAPPGHDDPAAADWVEDDRQAAAGTARASIATSRLAQTPARTAGAPAQAGLIHRLSSWPPVPARSRADRFPHPRLRALLGCRACGGVPARRSARAVRRPPLHPPGTADSRAGDLSSSRSCSPHTAPTRRPKPAPRRPRLVPARGRSPASRRRCP